MGTIYTSVDKIGNKEIIILNPNYSREQIAEKLKPAGYSEERLNTILEEGINLQKDLKIRCHTDGIITTQRKGSLNYFYKGDIVIIQPDGVFCIKPGIFRKIQFLINKKSTR